MWTAELHLVAWDWKANLGMRLCAEGCARVMVSWTILCISVKLRFERGIMVVTN